jgi:inorganic pyrophosphatase
MDISKLAIGDKSPEEVNVFIEIPFGSPVKYEMDKKTGFLTVDRFNFTGMCFPFNYGFIPSTKGEDGDPLDILVISTYPVNSGSVIKVRPIGLLEMEDEAGIDTKIISVPSKKIDPFMSKIDNVSDLEDSVKKRIKHFFDHYKELEPNKWVRTKEFLPKEKAYHEITQASKK